MAEELRKTGIGIVGSIPWGTHFCNFYETKEDLFDILIPYFKTGLENNEFCMWVIFPPHGKEEAKEALRRATPNADQCLAAGDIEILSHKEWYLKNGTFDLERVIKDWLEKLRQALARGYAGMRANGNEAWLTKEEWNNFSAYEEKLNNLIANQRMVVLCTYPLALVRAAELFDVARTHQFAIAKRRGRWEALGSPRTKRAWAEMRRLNKELEQRIIDRTNELVASNQSMIREVSDRKRVEQAVRESKQLLDLVLATLPVGVAVTDRAGDIILVNEASKRIWGGMIVSGRERWAQTKGFWHDSGERIAPANWASLRALSEGQTSLNELIDVETYDGQQKTILNSSAPIRNAEGLIVGAVFVNEDVTERVRAEEALKTTTEQLRALTARLESVREEEGRRIGQELHDEIGSAITSLKWDLEGLNKLCSEARGHVDCFTLRERIKGMVEVIDSTSSTVQKISSELRPAILDDLGLMPAIEWQAQQFAARTGIACQFDASVESIDLDREKVTAVFRIVQEALTNIMRHSQATRVNIIIEKEDDELIVEVKDNGRGITESEKAGPFSLGLIGMQERAHLIKGRIEITGFPGKGTVIILRVPISDKGSG